MSVPRIQAVLDELLQVGITEDDRLVAPSHNRIKSCGLPCHLTSAPTCWSRHYQQGIPVLTPVRNVVLLQALQHGHSVHGRPHGHVPAAVVVADNLLSKRTWALHEPQCRDTVYPPPFCFFRFCRAAYVPSCALPRALGGFCLMLQISSSSRMHGETGTRCGRRSVACSASRRT